MDGARHQFFSRTGFTCDEHCGLVAGHLLDVGQYMAQSWTLADDLVESVKGLDLRLEVVRFIHQRADAVLGGMAFVNISQDQSEKCFAIQFKARHGRFGRKMLASGADGLDAVGNPKGAVFGLALG